MDTAPNDFDILQGFWEQVYVEADGIVNPPDGFTSDGVLTTIRGNRFAVQRGNGAVLLQGVFEIDASTTPKSITWIDSIGADAGKRLPASYELTPDRFVFIAADEGAPRPLVFRTVPGLTMRAFKRRLGAG